MAEQDDFMDVLYQTAASAPVSILEEEKERGKQAPPEPSPYPDPILDLPEEMIEKIKLYLDETIQRYTDNQQQLQRTWSVYEEAYRAQPPKVEKTIPFRGACNDIIPAIAMAVDPVQARLDVGVLKQDPVFTVIPLSKTMAKYSNALSRFIEFNQRYRWKLRNELAPRLFEFAKLGTMVLKTVYEREEFDTLTYVRNAETGQWEVVTRRVLVYAGPKPIGLSIGDVMFDPGYQRLQDCPCVVERQRTTYGKLKKAEASGKFTNCKALIGQEDTERTELEESREKAAEHETMPSYPDSITVFECWFDYDVNDDGVPERLVATFHRPTRTLLQLRYNWYFHQRKPYTIIPYTVTNNSLYGIGIAEMVLPFQISLTRWHQMASDNAYLANIRMFIAKKNSGIEQSPSLYAGRTFFVDDPKNDFIPFFAGEIYPSTMVERQNLFGMVEKRTGISDYLTGRESPILGDRSTATATMALIEQGTKRVEEVLENLRSGLAEVIENCIYIWIQYGTENLEDLAFADDEVAKLVKEFFDQVSEINVHGGLSIGLTATDASSNKQVMQQLQLNIIQVMMQYLEKVLRAGAEALQAQQVPGLAEWLVEVTTKARNMFRDLLVKYEVPDPEKYLPDLEAFIAGQSQQGGTGAGAGGPAGAGGQSGVAAVDPTTARSGGADLERNLFSNGSGSLGVTTYGG